MAFPPEKLTPSPLFETVQNISRRHAERLLADPTLAARLDAEPDLDKRVAMATEGVVTPIRASDIAPVHAAPDTTAYEMASILRVQAARMVKRASGWESVALDVDWAAGMLEKLQDRIAALEDKLAERR